jgi:hypothetical protein
MNIKVNKVYKIAKKACGYYVISLTVFPSAAVLGENADL